MVSKKYLLFSLDDEKSKKLGQAISNSTCKKILALISEKELSEEDISKELKIPLNTVEYNLKKLLHSGLIEKSNVFFWSRRGKKIPVYRLANKLIVISPKNSGDVSSKIKKILPVAIVSGLLTILVSWFFKLRTSVSFAKVSDEVLLQSFAESVSTSTSASPMWFWFLIGWVSFLIIFLIWNWQKI